MSVIAQNPLTDHEYDGIREYDNPTPGWWHVLLGATVAFSFVYLVYWHGSVAGSSIHDAWEEAQRAEFARIFGGVGQLKHDEATIMEQVHNEKFMLIARSVFRGNCAACHARDGGGGVGVNLCDDHFKNASRAEDLFKVITDGAAGGAMPSWKNRLSDNERVIVAAYVASLRGTKPQSPKAPEGQPIPPWPEPSAAGK